jgi:outer membrane lipoprotein-sorting protein
VLRLLRTISTQRLLATVAGLVIAVAGGTAIAVAASGNGPVPVREPLAKAVHTALIAPTVQGVSARITFTNHLIDASDIQGTDPILQGASGRLWLSPSTNALRLELQSDNGDAQVLVKNRSFWIYDPTSNTAYEGTLPAENVTASRHHNARRDTIPSIAQIQSGLNRLMQHASLSGAIPSDVAGQPTYTVRVSPKHDGGLLGDAQLAFDAARGVPLRFAIYARNDSSPVLELKATDISFGAVPASDFAISPPRGAKVVRISAPASGSSPRHTGKKAGHEADVTGVAAVARRVHFALVAPKSLDGLGRRSVSLLDWSGHPAALVTYGQNVGGIVVVEQSARGATGLPSGVSGDHGHGLSLPTVSIDGRTARELDTALGTVLTFTRGQVAYTVLGSVPPVAAEAAARAL